MRKVSSKQPMFSPQDKDNIKWFWRLYLKDKTPWLIVVLVLVSLQAVVYQQFLSLTENGLRVIFEDGSIQKLAQVCAVVFFLFATRALLSYVVPRLSVWLAG